MIELSMWDYLERLLPIPLSKFRGKQTDERVTNEEEFSYRGLAGTLMYLGNSILPQASMTTSKMQQKLGNLRVKDVANGNSAVRDLMKLKPFIRYTRAPGPGDIRIISLRGESCDASHGEAGSIYGQTGSICGLVIQNGTIFRHHIPPNRSD